MPPTKQKSTGAHFTPAGLAELVAERISHLMKSRTGNIRILDPACGDGNLLLAMAKVLSPRVLSRCTLVGVEEDAESFSELKARLSQLRGCSTELVHGNFLDFADDRTLFGPSERLAPVDAIIANPPYVRTQVLGAKRSQELAATFGLSGRVDLYQAFLVAMTQQLKAQGILGVITSNRFLTTKGGAATRRFLRSHFDIDEIVDLGDTKLFEAAVLPALVFARKKGAHAKIANDATTSFVRIYEDVQTNPHDAKVSTSVVDLVKKRRAGAYVVGSRGYHVAVGTLDTRHDESRPWTMLTRDEQSWVEAVRSGANCLLRDVARIRVGIKTTADKIFVRRDWNCLPHDCRPEERFLRPVVSNDDAGRWRRATDAANDRSVLYTHEIKAGKRRAIPFGENTGAWKYLTAHRRELESRSYVIDAGRQWYEIWVPQDPDAWRLPKIVFPDISASARFFLDRDGAIVDGNCYWITTRDPADEDLLMLILGVANSTLMARFHDLAFPNKLYSQRRRYLTQYVQEYPLPSRESAAAKRILQLAKRLTDADGEQERATLEIKLDDAVEAAFGVHG